MHHEFQKVVVINLDRRQDRLRQFNATVAARGWPFVQPERIAAIDGRINPPPAWWQSSTGAWGNYQTQLGVIEQAIADDIDSLLILEDDATWTHTFAGDVAQALAGLPDDWECLYLGGQHVGDRPPELVAGSITRPAAGCGIARTHAWAMREAGLVKVRDHLRLLPEQTSLGARHHHIDQWLAVLHARGGLRVYAVTPWLIGQAGGKSDIARVDFEIERFWNEPRFVHGPTQPASARRQWLADLHRWWARSSIAEWLVIAGLLLISPLLGLLLLWDWLRQWRVVRVTSEPKRQGRSRVTGYRRPRQQVHTPRSKPRRRRRAVGVVN